MPRFKPRIAIAAVVDGNCESWYIKMLQRNERVNGFHLSPEIPSKKKIKEQYERIVTLLEVQEYDKVFWIVDCDTIAAETRVAKKGTETPHQELDKYISNLRAKYNTEENERVIIIRNNPCLEYWFLLHFEPTTAPFKDCDDARKRLKKHLPAYEKSQAFYTKQDKDIYLQLKPHLDNARKHARQSVTQAKGNADASISQMHLLFSALGL